MAKTTSSTKTTNAKPTTIKMQTNPNKTIARKKGAVTQEASSMSTPAEISREQREEMIRYAAYHIAEKDGFQSGREQEYWFQAQTQIDQLLGGMNNPLLEQH